MARFYRFGEVEIDLQGFRLSKAGKPLAVEPKALNLLVFLVEHRGRLVSRRELIDTVWNGAFVTDHVLNRAIGQLRKQLADDAKEPRYIETVPTLGYRFIAEVEAEAPEAPAPITPEQKILVEPPRLASEAPPNVPLNPRSSPTIARPLLALGAVLALAACVVAGWIWARGRHRSHPAAIRSLVVLPLENLSGDPSQQYLADGMTDELITNLGQIGALRVISETTALQYKDAHKPLPQIARELNVDAVIDGSVQRSGDQLRITTRLVDGAADKQLWAQSYEGDLRNVLSLQNQVASAVADQIRVKLTSQEQSQLASTPTVDPRAYEALLKGNYFFQKNSPETARKSLQYFQQAVKLDPNFARAYVGIARSYNFLGEGDVSPGEAAAASDAAVAKALQLDSNLAEAYAERAWTLLFYHWDFPGTERDFRHALELDPGSADAHEGYGAYLTVMGRLDQAVAEMERARQLDPLSPMVLSDYCGSLTNARRYDDAVVRCSAALELDPNYSFALGVSAELYMLRRDYATANKMLERMGMKDKLELDMADEINGAPGVKGAFDRWLKAQKTPPDPYFLAAANTGLGRKDQAFEWLEKAYEQRSNPHALTYVSVDPCFDPLRSDPRFDAFLRHVGLPPQPPVVVARAGSPKS